jgi:hypothetical protein
MHAVVVQVKINDPEGATTNLRENVVPQVSQAPGFVAGYWVGLGEKGGRAMIVFESEDAARAVAERIPSSAGGDEVSFESIDVGEVVESA